MFKAIVRVMTALLVNTAFAMYCYAAADDKNTDPATRIDNSGATNVLAGLVGTTKFKNVEGETYYPFNDSICGEKKVVRIFTRTSPVGDADYADLPVGSECVCFTVAALAVTTVTLYVKKGTGANDWSAILTDGNISVYGSDGALKKSYTTIDLAIAALANDDILKIKAGSYTLSAACDITATGVKIIGEGPVTIVGAAGADYCFKTVFGAITSTKGITIENINFDHGDDATQQGLLIDNVDATGRINVYLTDVSGESDGGDTIHVEHTASAASVRLYVTGGTFEGPVNFAVKNTDDRIRFEGSTLRGGLVTSADNIAMEIELWNCKVLHQGVTGGHSSQLAYAMYCISETDANPNVYAALDSNDLAGSHTESVLFPES